MPVKGTDKGLQLLIPGYLCSILKIFCLQALQEDSGYSLEYDQIFAKSVSKFVYDRTFHGRPGVFADGTWKILHMVHGHIPGVPYNLHVN